LTEPSSKAIFTYGKIMIDDPLNVFDEPLIEVTDEYLKYSKLTGNDLSTPMQEFGFPGLKQGDRWCLCAPRWLQAHENNVAPKVFLTRTHKRALETVPIAILRQYAADLN
jgi:uncharacterized protein (DUF2237 family)